MFEPIPFSKELSGLRVAELINKLKGGDSRSIGRANEVVADIGGDQHKFDEVFEGIFSDDKTVRARSANAAEKAAKKFPRLLTKHKKRIIKEIADFTQPEVRWLIALMTGYLELDKKELPKVVTLMEDWLLTEKHKFIKVACMQALADIALKNKWLRNEVIGLIESEMERGSAAIRARGRILLKVLINIE